MNTRVVYHCLDRNTKKTDNIYSSFIRAKNVSKITDRLTEEIAAMGLEDESRPPAAAAAPPPIAPEGFTMKKQFAKILENYKEELLLPDIFPEIILEHKLNIMIIDLYDFEKGFSISFYKSGEKEEIFHGVYSYGMGFLEHIKNGEVPYEVVDNLHKYPFKLFYDGYIICQFRLHFDEEDNIRSHFVFLKQTIQTIDRECAMRCKANSSLDMNEERARLISYYSPELCLSLDASSHSSFGLSNLRQHSFITPYLKHIIMNEKVRYEKGVVKKKRQHRRDEFDEMKEEVLKRLEKEKDLDSDEEMDMRGAIQEDAELSEKLEFEIDKLISSKETEYKSSMTSYLKARKMCFPGHEYFTGKERIHQNVEIENFVYEYSITTDAGKYENVQEKLRISVVNPKEYYYGCYKNSELLADNWHPIGSREHLDTYIMAITEKFEKMKRRCGEMVITHSRFFDEKINIHNKRMRIISKKLELPISEVVARIPSPTHSLIEKYFQKRVETSSESVTESLTESASENKLEELLD